MAKNTLTAASLREQNNADLATRLAEAKQELFRLRVRATTKELTNPDIIRKKKREIARINTVLTEKKAAR